MCQAPPTSNFGSTLSGSPPSHSQSSITLAQPPHSLPNDPTSHFPFPQTQPAPASLSQNFPILPNPLPDNSLAQLSAHSQQVATNSSFHLSHSLSPLPILSAPLSYSPIPSSPRPPHVLVPSPCPPTQLSTPAPKPPLSLEASSNAVISPPVLASTLASSLPSTLQVQPQLSSQHLTGLVNEVRLQSCSRSNFCSNMVRRLYSVEERKRSNVRGKLGKSKLDPSRLAIVRQTAFQVYPLATGEREETVWRHCIKAIDESCRRLNRVRLTTHV